MSPDSASESPQSDAFELDIAVLGLGAMGSRIAARLLDAGRQVAVYNRRPDRAAPLVERGARWCETPAEAASLARVVMSLVTDDSAAQAVWLDPERGAVVGLGPGSIAIESSTTTPTWIRRLSKAVAGRGAALLDAPVVGSRPQAEGGALVYLVGGAEDVLSSVRPLLDHAAANVFHMGEQGAGSRMKLLVNTLFGIQVAALGEMLGFAGRSGFDLAAVLDVLAELAVTSPALKGVGALVRAENFAPAFPIDLVAKDLRYSLESANSSGAATPLTEKTLEVFEEAQARGWGGENIAAAVKVYR